MCDHIYVLSGFFLHAAQQHKFNGTYMWKKERFRRCDMSKLKRNTTAVFDISARIVLSDIWWQNVAQKIITSTRLSSSPVASKQQTQKVAKNAKKAFARYSRSKYVDCVLEHMCCRHVNGEICINNATTSIEANRRVTTTTFLSQHKFKIYII